MKVAVIDGQGGGIGKVITEKLRKEFGENLDIFAFGTNALATSAMLRAGVNEGATGENAIVQNMSDIAAPEVTTSTLGMESPVIAVLIQRAVQML